MSMKTILVPMENHDAMQSALETALLLGRRCDSYIEGFALRWSINEFMVGDVMAGAPLETYREDIAEEAKKAKQIFEILHAETRCAALQPKRQSRCHSAGWTMRQRGRLHWQLWPRFRRDSDETARCALGPHTRQS